MYLMHMWFSQKDNMKACLSTIEGWPHERRIERHWITRFYMKVCYLYCKYLYTANLQYNLKCIQYEYEKYISAHYCAVTIITGVYSFYCSGFFFSKYNIHGSIGFSPKWKPCVHIVNCKKQILLFYLIHVHIHRMVQCKNIIQ